MKISLISIPMVILLFIAVCVLAATWIIFRRCRGTRQYGYMLAMAIASAGVGWWFGKMAEYLYPFKLDGVGRVAGAVFGLFIGVWHAVILSKSAQKHGPKGLTGEAILLGAGMGTLCAILVHSTIMIVHEQIPPEGLISLIVGVFFGAFVGGLLGLIKPDVKKQEPPDASA